LQPAWKDSASQFVVPSSLSNLPPEIPGTAPQIGIEYDEMQCIWRATFRSADALIHVYGQTQLEVCGMLADVLGEKRPG